MVSIGQNGEGEDWDSNSVYFTDGRMDDVILEVPPDMGCLIFVPGPPQ